MHDFIFYIFFFLSGLVETQLYCDTPANAFASELDSNAWLRPHVWSVVVPSR
jgi:hypothetical protein